MQICHQIPAKFSPPSIFQIIEKGRMISSFSIGQVPRTWNFKQGGEIQQKPNANTSLDNAWTSCAELAPYIFACLGPKQCASNSNSKNLQK